MDTDLSLSFSMEETKKCILHGIRARKHGAVKDSLSFSPLASITLSSQHDAPKQPPSAFTPEQLWLQEQLGRIPLFSRFAEQAKELREKKETEVAWKGQSGRHQAARDVKPPAAPAAQSQPVNLKKRAPKRPQKPKDLSSADEPIWSLFQELDADGNGTIDEAEISFGLEKMGLPSSPQAIVQLMGQFDVDGSGTISWNDFRTCVKRREDDIRAAFKTFDLDGNGEITGSELSKAMAAAGLPVTGRDVSRMMRILDKNESSSVNYDEFRRFACLVPSIYSTEGDNIRGWLATNAKRRASRKAQQKVEVHNDTAGQFVFVAFDLALRTSLCIALASAALYVANSD